MTEKLVLIADDDSEMRRVLETAMAVQQVRTMTASDHEQMLALARIEHPQLIIAGDVGKRRSDGFAVIKQLKTDPTTAAVPVLAVTGLCSPELHRAQTAGSDALLIKPVTATTLADVANLLIERAALLQTSVLRSMPDAETDAARTQPPAHATAPLPRCRGCGSDARGEGSHFYRLRSSWSPCPDFIVRLAVRLAKWLPVGVSRRSRLPVSCLALPSTAPVPAHGARRMPRLAQSLSFGDHMRHRGHDELMDRIAARVTKVARAVSALELGATVDLLFACRAAVDLRQRDRCPTRAHRGGI